MPSPFPGMDPYLEDPAIWSGFHAMFLGEIAEQIHRPLRPKYAVRIEERVYLTDETDPAHNLIVPDLRVVERDPYASTPHAPTAAIAEPIREVEERPVEVKHKYIQVLDLADRSVVTVMELLSPTNKVPNSRGRREFLAKKREVLESQANWMEIDLLRAGERSPARAGRDAEYVVYVSRAVDRARRERLTWPISLRQRLPVVGVPLKGDEQDVPLNLQAVLDAVVERGSYDLDTDYGREPATPLGPKQAEWARGVIAARTGG